jgi:hypothetical protein
MSNWKICSVSVEMAEAFQPAPVGRTRMSSSGGMTRCRCGLASIRPAQVTRGAPAGLSTAQPMVGRSGKQRNVVQRAAAAAPGREHSSVISPRCSSSEVK